ncbi:hypothetical protein QQZ08_011393 [Neonectria magnoliae]|uniref:AB hydrolase-1 domain-containing protein n=1 Tax=Neonectria magnoliae TaxID=2732573 RepID=A0ABR1HAL9_9HYPO
MNLLSLPGGLGPRPSGSTQVDGLDAKRPKYGKTLRVRGVPLDWDVERLQTCLEGDTPVDPVVRSLARETDGSSSTGTVTFQHLPTQLQALPPGKARRILLPKPSDNSTAPDRYLILDYDFLGITTLYSPAEDDHKVDIVAISGLGGHAFGWEGSGHPMARVMTYGYESGVAQSKSIQNLEDLATSFHNSLLELPHGQTNKPIILVAHSLGGLVVKQAS